MGLENESEVVQRGSENLTRTFLGVGFGVFATSCFVLCLKFLFNDDGNISNFSNHFKMIDEFGNRTVLVKILTLAAMPFGSLLFGMLCDQYGRLAMIQYQILLQFFCLFYSLIAFSSNVLIVTCLLSGFTFNSMIFTSFLHLFENSSQSKQIFYTALLFVASSSGWTIGSFFFYFGVNWRVFLVFCMTLCILGLKMVKESQKNLILPGKTLDLTKEDSQNETLDVTKKKNLSFFFSYFKRNFWKSFGFFLIFANSIMVYSAYNLFGIRIIENEYADGVLTGIIEILAMLVVIGTAPKYESSDILNVCIVISRLLVMFNYFLPESAILAIFVVAILKFEICIEVYLVYLILTLRMPIEFRGKMFGFCNFFGRTLGFLICFFLYLRIPEISSRNFLVSIFSLTSLIPLSLAY